MYYKSNYKVFNVKYFTDQHDRIVAGFDSSQKKHLQQKRRRGGRSRSRLQPQLGNARHTKCNERRDHDAHARHPSRRIRGGRGAAGATGLPHRQPLPPPPPRRELGERGGAAAATRTPPLPRPRPLLRRASLSLRARFGSEEGGGAHSLKAPRRAAAIASPSPPSPASRLWREGPSRWATMRERCSPRGQDICPHWLTALPRPRFFQARIEDVAGAAGSQKVSPPNKIERPGAVPALNLRICTRRLLHALRHIMHRSRPARDTLPRSSHATGPGRVGRGRGTGEADEER